MRVWREVLNLCEESERTRDAVGRVRKAGPYPRPGIPYPPQAPVEAPAPPAGGGAILEARIPLEEVGTPTPLPTPEGRPQESPILTSCLPHLDESPPPEAPDLGRPPLLARQLPWPLGEPAGPLSLPGMLPAPPLPRAHWSRDSRSRWRLDKALIRRN